MGMGKEVRKELGLQTRMVMYLKLLLGFFLTATGIRVDALAVVLLWDRQ